VTADENSIYQYFKSGNCGKINDIRIIKDARSQKSKGIAYVEFYLQESILKAYINIY
jgi:RNA-binding protein 39